MNLPGVHPNRHRQGQTTHRRGFRGCLAQADPHLHGCVAGLLGVVRPGEEEEQGVTAELEHLSAAGRGETQHRPEDPVQGLDDLLRADPTAARQSLREGGEPRHVGEHEGPVDDAEECPRRLVVPDEGARGHVATQVGQRLVLTFPAIRRSTVAPRG